MSSFEAESSFFLGNRNRSDHAAAKTEAVRYWIIYIKWIWHYSKSMELTTFLFIVDKFIHFTMHVYNLKD